MATITGTLSSFNATGTIHIGDPLSQHPTKVEKNVEITGSLTATNVIFNHDLVVKGPLQLNAVTIGGKLIANGPLHAIAINVIQGIVCTNPHVYLTKSSTPNIGVHIRHSNDLTPVKVFLQAHSHVGTIAFHSRGPKGEVHIDATSSVKEVHNGILIAHQTSKL